MESKKRLNVISKIKSIKKEYIFVAIILIAGIFLLLTATKSEQKKEVSVDEYVNNLETRLKSVLSQIKGCGNVEVMITVESGMVDVIATESEETLTENGKEYKISPVIVNGEVVVLQTTYPKIVGVLIVAEGADSISVKNKLLQSASSVLSISTEKIEILTMK